MSTEIRSYPFAVTDPFMPAKEFAWLRANEPVAQVRLPTGALVWLVTRYEDVRAVMCDQRFSRNLDRPDVASLIPGVRQPSSPFADPPAHTRWRRLLSKEFTARRVEGMRADVESAVENLLDRMEVQPKPVDLMQAIAFPLPVTVVCALLGISVDKHGRFREGAKAALSTGDELSPEEKTAAFMDMLAATGELIADKRQHPGTDLLSALVAAHDEDDGRLSEDQLVATVVTLLVGGYENPAHQFGKAVQLLFAHPAQLDALRADPGLISSAAEETLRYAAAIDSGFGSPRYATQDVQVGDATIPKGATVLVIRQSANRDDTHFDDPDRFDITREPSQHFSFGVGPHFCLGASLARLELEVGVAGLLRRFPGLALTVPADEVPWAYRVTTAGPASLPVTW
jgi:cytochrome P450